MTRADPPSPPGPCSPTGDAAAPDGGRLQIGPAGASVAVAPGQTLLEAALAHGLPLRSSCRNGTCRACRVPMRSGQVRYRIEWPGLSADEKAEGWILPCVALAVGDVVIEGGVLPRSPSPGGPEGP